MLARAVLRGAWSSGRSGGATLGASVRATAARPWTPASTSLVSLSSGPNRHWHQQHQQQQQQQQQAHHCGTLPLGGGLGLPAAGSGERRETCGSAALSAGATSGVLFSSAQLASCAQQLRRLQTSATGAPRRSFHAAASTRASPPADNGQDGADLSLDAVANASAELSSSASSSSTTAADTIDAIVQHAPVAIGQLRELGLGSLYTPVGFIQNTIEAVTALSGLSWAGGIVLTTLLLRSAMLPVAVAAMKNNIALSNIRPELALHTERMQACAKAGDAEGQSQAQANLSKLLKDNNCHPGKSFLFIFLQAPVFVSFFIGLRKMAALPVESLQTGGASWLWFSDLTTHDPYYILPVLACTSMLATIELGSEGMQQQPHMKNFFRVMSLVILPLTANFPVAVFLYWVTSNMFSLSQLAFLKIPAVRDFFNIPIQIKHPESAMPKSKTGFIEGLKTSYRTAQQRAEQEAFAKQEKQRMEAMAAMKIPKSASAASTSTTSDDTKSSSSSSSNNNPKRARRSRRRTK